MSKPKSFLQNLSLDVAKRTHNCQHNSSHLIAQGETRLKLKTGRTQEYFCVQCAIDSINRDIMQLESLKKQLLGKDT